MASIEAERLLQTKHAGQRETEDGVMDVAQKVEKSQRVETIWSRRFGWMMFHFRVIIILISGGFRLFDSDVSCISPLESKFFFSNVKLIKIALTAKTTFCGVERTLRQRHGFDPSLASSLHVIPSITTRSCLSLTIKGKKKNTTYNNLNFDFCKSHLCFTHTSHHMISVNPEEYIIDSC